MSQVLVLLLAWLLLSVPVALLLGRALSQGRTAALHRDLDAGPTGRSGPRRVVRRPDGNSRLPTEQGPLDSQPPTEPRLALVDPGTVRSRGRPDDALS
jgi:hypothetical protein